MTFVIREEGLSWWQNMLDSVGALAMSKSTRSMLAAIKTGVESQSSPAA